MSKCVNVYAAYVERSVHRVLPKIRLELSEKSFSFA